MKNEWIFLTKRWLRTSFMLQKAAPATNWLLSVFLVIFTFPEWKPEMDISIDSSCAWLYNHLFCENPALLAHLIFPHGPLDFLQTPLPMGYNLEIALVADTLLRVLFVWSGLRWVARLAPRHYWVQALLLGIALELNRMDLLLFATTAHFILLALTLRDWKWLAPAAFLTAVGLLTKTIIGMPGAMMMALGAGLLWRENKTQRAAIAGVCLSLPLWMAALWALTTGSLAGFATMLQGTFYLMQGNSAAVCHYPTNNWWLLGVFWAVWLFWPFGADAQGKKIWWLLTLPAFAFWKYGVSREDIWHLHTTFRYFLWAFGVLLIAAPVWGKYAIFAALTALSCFHLNMRVAEGWAHFDIRPFGLSNFYDWTVRFKAQKAAAAAAGEERLKPHVLPDSIRTWIGDRTIDIFPWHYSYAAANRLHLRPRHIPQSYAAYHPELDRLDADFFSGTAAPELLLIHLKPIAEMGQLMSIDDRYLLQDAPLTMKAILERYRVARRHPKFVILEKTQAAWTPAETTETYRAGWTPPESQTGYAYLKIPLKKTGKGQVRSIFYKDAPVFADVQTGAITRRIKLVPALTADGVWYAPWIEAPSRQEEPYRTPLSVQLFMPEAGYWKSDSSEWKIVWHTARPDGGWVCAVDPPERLYKAGIHRLDTATEVAPNGFSPDLDIRIDSTGRGQTLALEAEVRSPNNAGCCFLVCKGIDAKGKELWYHSTEYCGMGVGTAWFWPLGLRATLPQDAVYPIQAKVYVWNPGVKTIQVKNLKAR